MWHTGFVLVQCQVQMVQAPQQQPGFSCYLDLYSLGFVVIFSWCMVTTCQS